MNGQTMTFQDVWQSMIAKLPQMLAAVLILVGGYILALLIASTTRMVLRRLNIDTYVQNWLGDEGVTPRVSPSNWTSRVVYYIVLLFVLVAFFQVLGLTLITVPLNRFLEQIFVYAPRLLGAAALLGIAILVANIARLVVRRVLSNIRLDERVRAETGEAVLPTSQVAANTIYWIVLVIFLPAILGALGLTGLMEPVQRMVNKALDALPNILTAAVILLAGFFLARLAQRFTVNMSTALGANQLSDKIGLTSLLGRYSLAQVLGGIAYALVIVPMFTAAMQALAFKAITDPITNMLDRLIGALPVFFGAVLALVIGYVIARLASSFTIQILSGLGFDRLVEQIGIRVPEGARRPAEWAGQIVLLAVLYITFLQAAQILELNMVAGILRNFLSFAGHIGLGLLIFALGLYLARLAASVIQSSGVGQASLLAGLVRALILVFAGAMALRQMGLANEIVILAFAMLTGAIALAAALAFGLGGREVAARELENYIAQLRSREQTEEKR